MNQSGFLFGESIESSLIKNHQKNQIMALIKCKECGREISSAASSCPHCGAPVKSEKAGRTSMIYMITFIIVGIALGIAAFAIEDSWIGGASIQEQNTVAMLQVLCPISFVIALVFLIKMIVDKRR